MSEEKHKNCVYFFGAFAVYLLDLFMLLVEILIDIKTTYKLYLVSTFKKA